MSSVWYSLLLLSHQKSASTQQAALAELAMVMISRAIVMMEAANFIFAWFEGVVVLGLLLWWWWWW